MAKYVRILMSDAQHASLMRKAVALGFPNLESYFQDIAGERSMFMDCFTEVLNAWHALPEGRSVTLCKLMGAEWENVPLNVKINVGKMFNSGVKHGLIKIARKHKTTAGHAVYTK